jgi:hypothetical protein
MVSVNDLPYKSYFPAPPGRIELAISPPEGDHLCKRLALGW